MKRSIAIILPLIAIGIIGFQPVPGVSAQGGWTTLFDGSSLCRLECARQRQLGTGGWCGAGG